MALRAPAWLTARLLDRGKAPVGGWKKLIVVPDYILIPLLLVLMSVGLMALIYWGSFIEERRNGRSRT